jgi:hypothetical protein
MTELPPRKQITKPDPMPALLSDARVWLADCDERLEFDRLTDPQVIMLVHRSFEGGWEGFVASDLDADAASIKFAVHIKYGAEFMRKVYE